MNTDAGGSDSNNRHWREKFLAKVDELEKAEQQAQHLHDLLKSGLLRLSLAADGLDTQLDKELEELRQLLKQQAPAFRLEQHFEELKLTILTLDEKKQQRVQQYIQALQTLSQPLQQLSNDKSLIKELDFFTSQLKYRCQDETAYSQLLTEWSQLQQQLLHGSQAASGNAASRDADNIASNKAQGLFHALFHGKQSNNGDNANKKTQERANGKFEEESYREASQQADSFDLNEVMEEVFDGDILQQQQLNHHSHNPQPSPLGKPKSFNDSAIHFQRQKYQQGENVSFETIADHISDIFHALFRQLDAKGQALDYIGSAQEQLNLGLNCLRLIPTLENTSHAVISLQSQNQQDFSDYLKALNDSLQGIQQSLQLATANNIQCNLALDNTIHQQISTLQEDVAQATDLQNLKDSVQLRANSLLQGIEQFKQQQLHSKHSLSAQLSTLHERLELMEDEAETTQHQLTLQRQQALTDSLTQLPNRAALDERLSIEVSRWQRYKNPLCVLIADIDLFKQVNDNWGHHAGDKVLQIIARQLKMRLRESDFIARFGGEEFILLLTETSLSDGRKIAEQLRSAVADCPFHFKEQSISVTISTGLACFRVGDDFNSVFERADQALYMAKTGGRNTVRSELDLQ